MSRQLANWLGSVRKWGYTSEGEMLRDLYEAKGLSIEQIREQLDSASDSNIRYRLQKHGIPLRRRGGANHRKVE